MLVSGGPLGSVTSFKSCPALNALPSPVITTQRTSGSVSHSTSAFCMAKAMSRLKLLKTSGRFIVICTTAPERSTFNVAMFVFMDESGEYKNRQAFMVPAGQNKVVPRYKMNLGIGEIGRASCRER